MNLNLDSYVLVFDEWLDKSICRQTVLDLQKSNWEQHTFYDNNTDIITTLSGSKELDVSYDFLKHHPYLMQRVWDCLKKYIEELNFSWYRSWSGYSSIRYNKYKESRVMAKHCDHIHTLFDGNNKGIPVLSILGLLNSDFTGGNFVMWDDTVIPLKEGSVVVFPSNFLYPHKVEPVLTGTRYSCISWAW